MGWPRVVEGEAAHMLSGRCQSQMRFKNSVGHEPALMDIFTKDIRSSHILLGACLSVKKMLVSWIRWEHRSPLQVLWSNALSRAAIVVARAHWKYSE